MKFMHINKTIVFSEKIQNGLDAREKSAKKLDLNVTTKVFAKKQT
jgi:hypothetical protein